MRTGYPRVLAALFACSRDSSLLHGGWGIWRTSSSALNLALSSALSMSSAAVPRILTPAVASWSARLFGIWPPTLTTTKSGPSLSTMSRTLSMDSSSK